VELPDAEDDRSDPLSQEEARTLLEATRTDRLHALWRLALATGLREGELLGLLWDDRAGDQITVKAQLQRLSQAQGADPQGWARTIPKAARAVESVTIDAATSAILDEHKLHQAEERQPSWRYFGMMFVTPAGNPYHGADIMKAFREACDKAKIRRRRFHDLRHSSATLMRADGVAEDTRMARLGHSTTAMSRKYAKASPAQDRAAADTLGRALGG
jgi:integrase